MKQSTSILRGMNDIRADYILESELPDMATAPTVAPRSTARETWQRITSSGWFVAAVCAIVAFGTLAGIIWAGQRGPGVVTPAGTVAESTAEKTEEVTEATNSLRALMKKTIYDADGNEKYITQYTYESGLLVREKYTFVEIPSAGWTITYEYDGEGRVILRRVVYDNNKTTDETRTEYDEFGRIFREESKDSVTTYTYDENNNLIILTAEHKNKSISRLERTLDERGKVIRERSYLNEELISDYMYEYNENGQKIKYCSCPTDGSSSRNETVYDYDESGNLVRVTITWDLNQSTYIRLYEYNEYGEKTKELRYTYVDSELESSSTIVYKYGIIS